MGFFASNMSSCSTSISPFTYEITRTYYYPLHPNSLPLPTSFGFRNFHFGPILVSMNVEKTEKVEIEEEKKPRFTWVEVGPNITETQKQAISQLPYKMTKRCKALMRQIICFSPEKTSLPLLFAAWVRIMKPRRADWLSVLKELERLDHPMLLEVSNLSLNFKSYFYFLSFPACYCRHSSYRDSRDLMSPILFMSTVNRLLIVILSR